MAELSISQLVIIWTSLWVATLISDRTVTHSDTTQASDESLKHHEVPTPKFASAPSTGPSVTFLFWLVLTFLM